MLGNTLWAFSIVLTLQMTKFQLVRQKTATKCDDYHAATEVPVPLLAFLSSVKPSAAICGHYPGDQTETQADSTCSEAIRQGLLKDSPLKNAYQTDFADQTTRLQADEEVKSKILLVQHKFFVCETEHRTLTGQQYRQKQ